ncbi:MAG: hypothetical protein ACUVWO_01580 [Thermodesulfobacteriota bacterium]
MNHENMDSHNEKVSVLMTHPSLLLFRVADVNIELLSSDSALQIGLEGAMKEFVVEERKPDITIQAIWNDLSETTKGKLIFDSGDLWKLYSDNGDYCFRFTSPIMGAHPYKMATFSREFDSGEISLHKSYFNQNQPTYPLEYPLDELMINNFLARGKGVEVHACGILNSQGQGCLFLGQSAAGKTTMAKLWVDEPNVEVLSDDRIILRRMGNKTWMYGTPWHGEAMLASPNRAPLSAIYFLEKGSQNELIPQKTSDSISRLFACSFPPFYNRDALEFTLGFLEDVVSGVHCWELRFTPDKRVVDLIQEERFT